MKTPRPRRVLHVLKFYRPAFTGEGVFLKRSSAVMQELAAGIEHDLLVTQTPSPPDGEASAYCSTLKQVIHLSQGVLSNTQRELRLCWWFLRHLHRYEVVHFRTHADWYFLSYALSRLAGRRLVLSATLDDSLPMLVGHYRPALRGMTRRLFGLFNAHIGINPRLHEQNQSLATRPADCHLVACGVTVPPDVPGGRAALRARLGIGENDPVLLFVGGLCLRKDPRFLIDALPAIAAHHPGVQLLLVGPPLEPDYVAALKGATEVLGLRKAVHFAGEQLDPHPWFAAADILVFASQLEGFGTVVPEAMAHRLPVVVRRLPGVTDSFVQPGETGFLFDDQSEFQAAVLRLLGDAGLRARLGQAGAALVAREFGMRQVAARYLGIYGLAAAVQQPPKDTPETALGCTASIVDRRFHAQAEMPARDGPLLITMVDAEEAFDWSRPFSRNHCNVTSMRSQQLAHRVFERHGVVPVYLTDYPVVAQDAGRAPLRELLDSGLCDVGAQLHPWVTPPFTEIIGDDNSYAGSLPVATEFEKARHLTDALAQTFGQHPLIYRTGRFGVGLRTADILKRLGYVADSSVAPCWPQGALRQYPEFWRGALAPYWVDHERSLMEIPVSAGLVGHLAGRCGGHLAPLLFHPAAQRLRISGMAAKLGLLERIRLTPEGMTIEEAKRLTRAMFANGQRVFVLTYHSPSLEPGNTPYVRTMAQREEFLRWLDAFYSFFREEMGGRNSTWREVRFGTAAVAAMPARSMASVS